MVFVGKSVCGCVCGCQRQDNRVQQRWGMHSLLLGFYIFYIVYLQRQVNISVPDGQHVIFMLSLWQQLKVKLRHSCRRQRLRVIKMEALVKNSNLTSWEKLIPKSNVKCINFAWMFPHPS